MFLYPIEAIFVLAALAVCFLAYQKLIKSPRFRSLVSDTVDPPADTDDEVVASLDKAVSGAEEHIEKNTAEAAKRKATNERLAKKLRRQ